MKALATYIPPPPPIILPASGGSGDAMFPGWYVAIGLAVFIVGALIAVGFGAYVFTTDEREDGLFFATIGTVVAFVVAFLWIVALPLAAVFLLVRHVIRKVAP